MQKTYSKYLKCDNCGHTQKLPRATHTYKCKNITLEISCVKCGDTSLHQITFKEYRKNRYSPNWR